MAGWTVFGCRTAHAPEVAESIWRRGDDLVALVDNLPDPQPCPWGVGAPVVSADDLDDRLRRVGTVIPQTTPGVRYSVARDAMARGLDSFPALIDPTAVVGRTVVVSRGAFVGAGAVCAPGVRIGSNATIGAGAVVVRDVADGDLVVGNPARVLRSGTVGFAGVGVP